MVIAQPEGSILVACCNRFKFSETLAGKGRKVTTEIDKKFIRLRMSHQYCHSEVQHLRIIVDGSGWPICL